MRRPAEQLSQRQLVYQLRYALDEGKMREAASLVASHPRGMRSRHVTHNLGARRARVAMSLRGRSFGSFDAE